MEPDLVGYEAQRLFWSESDQTKLQSWHCQLELYRSTRADRTMSFGTSRDPHLGQIRNTSGSIISPTSD